MSHTTSSISKLLDQLIGNRGNADTRDPRWFRSHPNFWFRGQAKCEWLLQPKVLRKEQANDFANRAMTCEQWMSQIGNGEHAIFRLAGSLFNQLQYRGHHLLNDGEKLSLTDMYFLAHHHGLPTHLLDWSTNALVAAFFAVATEPKDDGAVFVLRARHEIGGEEGGDINSDTEKVAEFVECLLDNSSLYQDNSGAAYRIMPHMRVGRILQQSARFTLHYPGCRDLEQIDNLVEKFVIPLGEKPAIREELRSLNVDWGTVYPDLPNLIRQVCEECGLA